MTDTKASASRTPGPWLYGELSESIIGPRAAPVCDFDNARDTFSVPETEIAANAAFIVRACNAHDELVAALREIIAAFDGDTECTEILDMIDNNLRAALKHAEEA